MEGLIPWLRVPDLELWMGSLSDIYWETIHSFTQHSGMPPLVPPGFWTQRVSDKPEVNVPESGAPRSPCLHRGQPCGLPQLAPAPWAGPNEVSIRLGLLRDFDPACHCSWSQAASVRLLDSRFWAVPAPSCLGAATLIRGGFGVAICQFGLCLSPAPSLDVSVGLT